MNDNELKDVLLDVISRILQDAAFLFTDDFDEEMTPDFTTWKPRGAQLSFKGPSSGSLHIWAESDFYKIAAANMLGIDENDAEAEKKGIDALKELLNMIVGNFLTEAYGKDEFFELGIPSVLENEQLEKDYTNDENVWLDADGNAVLFSLISES